MAAKVSYANMVRGLTEEQQQYIALDCEMVMARKGGVEKHALAQIALVDWNGKRIYKTYVKPEGEITNYLSEFSGIKEGMLDDAPPFAEVQADVLDILADKIVVGHSLESDFKALGIDYDPDAMWIRNTALANIYRKNVVKPSGETYRGASKLKNLVETYLKEQIQTGSHDPEIDARAAMLLFKRAKKEIEDPIYSKAQAKQMEFLAQMMEMMSASQSQYQQYPAGGRMKRRKTGKRKAHKQRKTRKQRR